MTFLKNLSLLLLLAIAAYGQQERIAIIQTLDDRDSIGFSELSYLTDRLRETAVNILPKQRYGIMTTESIVAFLGSQERAMKTCKEASCLAELGRKVNADYVAQARIGRFEGDLTIKVELYSSKSGVMIGSFTGSSKNMSGLLAIMDEKASVLLKKLPGASDDLNAPIVAGGISGVESKGGNYEKSYPVNISTDPVEAAFSFKDPRDNKTYKITKIGNQTWMAENLDYNASGSKCLKNQESNCQKYGRLYDWNTAKTACPSGWHLPSDAEWDVLMKSVNPSCSPKSNCANAGKLLKSKSGWNSNGNGTDGFGFSALPGGGGFSGGGFYGVGNDGYWWSATEYSANGAYYRDMDYYYEDVFRDDDSKLRLFSVRCLQD